LEISVLLSKEKSIKNALSKASIHELGNKYLTEAAVKIKSSGRDKKESLSTN
jgi:hypothetical protein